MRRDIVLLVAGLLLGRVMIAPVAAQSRSGEMEAKQWVDAGFTPLHLPYLGETQHFLSQREVTIVPGVEFAPPVFPKSPSEPNVPREDVKYEQFRNVITSWLQYGNFYAIARWIFTQIPRGAWDFKYQGESIGGEYSMRLSDAGNYVNGLTGEQLFPSLPFLNLGNGGVKIMTNLVLEWKTGKKVDYGAWWSGLTNGGKPRGWIFTQMGYEESASGEVIREFIDDGRPLPPEMGGPAATYGDLRRAALRPSDIEVEIRSQSLEDAALRLDGTLYREMKKEDSEREEKRRLEALRQYQESMERLRCQQQEIDNEIREIALSRARAARMRAQNDAAFQNKPQPNAITPMWAAPSTSLPSSFSNTCFNCGGMKQSPYAPTPLFPQYSGGGTYLPPPPPVDNDNGETSIYLPDD